MTAQKNGSSLKGERESFPLFVPKRSCIPGRLNETFITFRQSQNAQKRSTSDGRKRSRFKKLTLIFYLETILAKNSI